MSNVDTARSDYQAFRSGDLGALNKFCADDAIWYSSGEVRPGGEVRGRDAIIDTFARIPHHWTMASIEPTTYIDGGEYMVVLGNQRFANDKGSDESPFVNVLRFDRDGKVVHGEFTPTARKWPICNAEQPCSP